MAAASDLDRALDASLVFARRMLGDHGAFAPFAAVVDARGVAIATVPGTPAGGDAAAALDALVARLRARRDELFAVALVTNATTSELGDVIHVALEAPGDDPASVVVPYRAQRRPRAVAIDAPRRLARRTSLDERRRVWGER